MSLNEKCEGILIVDDYLDFLESLESNLSLSGYRVKTASTESKAIELAKQHPNYFIISEYIFRYSNGPEFLKKIKKNNQNLRAMILTWAEDNEVFDKLKEAKSEGLIVGFEFKDCKIDKIIKKYIERFVEKDEEMIRKYSK